MQLAKFIYSAAKEHNTSLGNNKALPQREDVSYEYIMLKRRFKQVVEQIEKTFGHIPSVDEAEHLLSKLIVKTQKLEEPLRPQLEKLCEAVVTNVLSVPQETILLECNLVSEIEPEQEIRILPEFDDEESGYDFSDVDEVTMANEAILKRRMVNSLVQGVSYLLMMDNFDNTKLSEWSDELPQLYMQIIALNDYLLYSKQEKISDKNPMLGAYVETHLGKGDEKTVITSQGLIYPLLLQETFRGFFELFGSHGLPDKTDAAMYVIKHADFIVAEAWDLRIGVPLWETIENCCGTVESSIYPYIFSSIAELPIEDFNKTLQNIFLNTKSGRKFVDNIVREVKHDKEYNLFKQDLERFNLEKCVINDEENSDEGLLKEEEIDNKFMHSDKIKAWFAGSKVVNPDGSPKLMYRGDENQIDSFDRSYSSSSNLYGTGFYFTDSKSHAMQYGHAQPYYLKITHPLSTDGHEITKKQMYDFLVAVDENDDYGLYNYGYGANPRTVLSSVWGKSDFAMLLDVNACCIGDLVNATLLFNEVNGTDFDGFILDTETVVFDNSQIYPVKNRITESKQSLINEGISDVTYHFCSLPSLHSILESGKLALTMSSNMADAYHKTKLFYLSTQRSKSSRLGYAGNSSAHGRNSIARIELDGNMLKRAGFQGRPLDYWGASMGKQSDIGLNSSRVQAQFAGGKDFHPETQEDKEAILKSQQTSSNFEFEDRIFSNKPSISLTYIKRIDCLVTGGKITPIEKSILQLAENRGVLVSFYDNEKDFVRETTNTLNQQILNSEGEYENPRKGKPDEERLAYNAKTVATLSAILLYYSYYNNMVNGVPGEKTLTKLNNALSKFGLERYYNYCVEELPKIAMFLEENIGTSFEDSLRKANTNDLTKNSLSDNVMSYAQYVFNHYGVNSCRALRMYFKNHPYQSKKPKNIQLQEKVQCVEINYGGSSAMIYRGDTSPFWGRWFDKDMFYQDISRQLEEDDWNEQNGYGDDRSIYHKSKDSQSFLKYIQHLTHNDNLSLYDGAIILNKIFNYDQGKISTMFGFTIKPVEVDREYFKQNENRFSFEDGKSVKESLFGSDKAYLDWLFPKE